MASRAVGAVFPRSGSHLRVRRAFRARKAAFGGLARPKPIKSSPRGQKGLRGEKRGWGHPASSNRGTDRVTPTFRFAIWSLPESSGLNYRRRARQQLPQRLRVPASDPQDIRVEARQPISQRRENHHSQRQIFALHLLSDFAEGSKLPADAVVLQTKRLPGETRRPAPTTAEREAPVESAQGRRSQRPPADPAPAAPPERPANPLPLPSAAAVPTRPASRVGQPPAPTSASCESSASPMLIAFRPRRLHHWIFPRAPPADFHMALRGKAHLASYRRPEERSRISPLSPS